MLRLSKFEVQKAFPHAKLALKDASSLPKAEEALMHDIVACVYAKEKRLRSALRHFDKALVCAPLATIRNYWKFLKKNKLNVTSIHTMMVIMISYCHLNKIDELFDEILVKHTCSYVNIHCNVFFTAPAHCARYWRLSRRTKKSL